MIFRIACYVIESLRPRANSTYQARFAVRSPMHFCLSTAIHISSMSTWRPFLRSYFYKRLYTCARASWRPLTTRFIFIYNSVLPLASHPYPNTTSTRRPTISTLVSTSPPLTTSHLPDQLLFSPPTTTSIPINTTFLTPPQCGSIMNTSSCTFQTPNGQKPTLSIWIVNGQ